MRLRRCCICHSVLIDPILLVDGTALDLNDGYAVVPDLLLAKLP